MKLKTTKIYVPIDNFIGDGTPILLITEHCHNEDKVRHVKVQELYTLTKEELERVIRDACNTNFQSKVQESCGVLYYETLKQDYINSILK